MDSDLLILIPSHSWNDVHGVHGRPGRGQQVTLALGVIPNVMLPGSMGMKKGGWMNPKPWRDILEELPPKVVPFVTLKWPVGKSRLS